MKFLFLHFPKDNSQVEALSLPVYFSKAGHDSYLAFEKGSRNFFCRVNGSSAEDLRKEDLFDIDFDIIVGKSSAFRSYDARYISSSRPFKVNIQCLGLPANKRGIDYCFEDDQLLKSPPLDMWEEFVQYNNYESRENLIFMPASIGTDKNQLEFINLVDPDLIRDYIFLFAGPIRSERYFNRMVEGLKNKNIKHTYLGHLQKNDIAKIMKRSKVVSLTTDPRPAQPYDPSPRVIPEAVCAGTPFFINDLVLVPECLRSHGFVYKNGNQQDFNDILSKVLSSDLVTLSRESFNLGKEKLTMDKACEKAYNDIIEAFERNIA
jgi:hypothetical protein